MALSTPTERTETFEAAANDVWVALRDAAGTVKGLRVTSSDDAERRLELDAGISLTTWGQRHTASVAPRGDVCELRMAGRPKLWTVTAKRKIVQQQQALIDAIRARLTRQSMT